MKKINLFNFTVFLAVLALMLIGTPAFASPGGGHGGGGGGGPDYGFAVLDGNQSQVRVGETLMVPFTAVTLELGMQAQNVHGFGVNADGKIELNQIQGRFHENYSRFGPFSVYHVGATIETQAVEGRIHPTRCGRNGNGSAFNADALTLYGGGTLSYTVPGAIGTKTGQGGLLAIRGDTHGGAHLRQSNAVGSDLYSLTTGKNSWVETQASVRASLMGRAKNGGSYAGKIEFAQGSDTNLVRASGFMAAGQNIGASGSIAGYDSRNADLEANLSMANSAGYFQGSPDGGFQAGSSSVEININIGGHRPR